MEKHTCRKAGRCALFLLHQGLRASNGPWLYATAAQGLEKGKHTMIEVGHRSKAKYWGEFEVRGVVRLGAPVRCESVDKGEVDFNPTIVKLEWDREPSGDKHDIWFPYWITTEGKERYGQFAPMIGQTALLELLSKAIDAGFFDRAFLEALSAKLSSYLERDA